ncbi:MAG TPA: hypothetical protein P5110_08185 [Candidatus Omnitrophota bacterium]|nr:hypothetical protein [Candidatus Omnitrophota bacterium]HRZ15471.1 hypothetical protein [Candidatus Omnitrophota bacterium]
MSEQKSFYQVVEEICEKDARYKPDSYEFVLQALHFTQKKLARNGHVTGQELLEGIREHALKQFGPMARTVLNYWGITKTGDFGAIVFIMIEHKLLSRTEQDTLQDFEDVYDFDNAFKHTVTDIVI